MTTKVFVDFYEKKTKPLSSQSEAEITTEGMIFRLSSCKNNVIFPGKTIACLLKESTLAC